MDEEQQPQPQQNLPIPAIVSAGESDHNHLSSSDDDDDDDEEEKALPSEDIARATTATSSSSASASIQQSHDALYYGAHLDNEDEAWVYQNLRSGMAQDVTIRSSSSSSPNNNNNSGQVLLEKAKLLKPRNSDAVLSCPCCFAIVCMDCQRHERYQNQFRAMFVMNIGVDWESKLVYDNLSRGLIQKTDGSTNANDEVYQSVFCLECKTQVAALDMKEEIYHFFGCLASS